VGRWATDFYLQRVVIATCSAALVAALVLALIPSRPQVVPVVHPGSAPPAIVDFIHVTTPPALRQDIGPVTIRQHDIPIPKPVPDDALVSEPEVGFETGGAFGTDGPGMQAPGTTDGLWDGNAAPSLPTAPEIFLFVEVPPELVSITNPVYPELAREAGVEGTVHVKVLVSEEGFVLEAFVLEGLPLLDEAALEAARSALFRPAQQSGQPVRTWVVMPIEFSLRH